MLYSQQEDLEIKSINDLISKCRHDSDVKSNYDSLMFYSAMIIERSQKANYKTGVAEGKFHMANAKMLVGKHQSAETMLKEGLEIYTALNDIGGITRFLNSFSWLFILKSDYVKAIETARQVLDYEDVPVFEKAIAYNNLAASYYYIGNYHKSIDFFYSASEIAKQANNDDELFVIYNNIAAIYASQNNHEEALEFFQKAYRHLVEHDETSYKKPTILINIGYVFMRMQHYETAQAYFDSALESLHESNKVLPRAQAYSNLAELHLLKESFHTASGYINKAITIYKEAGNNHGLALSYARKAQISLHLDGVNQAIADAYLASEHAGISGSMARQNEALRLLGNFYSMINDYENAFTFLEKHKTLNDSLFNIERASLIENLNTSYQVNRKEQEINQLKANQAITKMTLRNRKKINVILATSLFLFSLLIILLFIQYQRTRKSYKLLVNKNQEMLAAQSRENGKHLDKEKTPALTEEEKQVVADLKAAMSRHKLYLNKDLTLGETAKHLNITRNILSRTIGIYFNTNFNSFINQYRITEACKLMGSSENDNYSIEGIANLCGFGNRQTFYAAFKKNVGVTPSFYLKSIRKM